MFWGDGDPLALTLDKADLWDLRSNTDYLDQPDFTYRSLRRLVAEGRFPDVDEIFEQRQRLDNPVGPTKISIGRAELRLGETVAYECALDLSTATVQGLLVSPAGRHRLRAFVHREWNVVCLRVDGAPAAADLQLRTLADTNDALAPLGHPPPRVDTDGDIRVLTQQIPEGPAYAVAWNVRGPEYFIAIESEDTQEAAAAAARTTLEAARKAGFDDLHAGHVDAWRRFWAGSAVHPPEPRIEFLWYHSLYLLASATRRGSVPPGLQGLWPMDGVLPPWRGDYHADMNVQETFWPACASGHLDLLDSWCDLMRDSTPAAQDFTRRFFGTEGTFWPCCTLPRHTIVLCWHTVQFAWSHSGWLAWLVWLRWRHSMDPEWLADTGYPLVSEVFRFYRANLAEEADGRLHIPLSSSPEYRENKPEAWCKDPNIDIALVCRCCEWVIEMERALGRADLTPDAQGILQKLVPYHLTEGGTLCLWADKPLDESHRHPSHLMAIHPAMDVTVDGTDRERDIIRASLDHYFSLGQYLWAGHTYAQLASMAAVVGRGELAYDCLLRFVEYWVGPNALHFNRDLREVGVSAYRGRDRPFTMEANCAIGAGISDMLLQGWGDTLRVFPAVPEHWRDIGFRDLLAEGAFRASAVRRDGRTVWVHVRAQVSSLLRLRDPFGGAAFETQGPEVRREGNDLLAEFPAGEAITLRLAGDDMPWEPAEALKRARHLVQQSDVSRLGLR